MPFPTKKEVKEVYRKHFKTTRKFADAWNLTLDELAGPFGQGDPALRESIVSSLKKVHDDVEFEEGDPATLAFRSALAALQKDKVVSVAREAAAEAEKEIKEELKKRIKPPGPKEWRPRGRLPDEDDLVEEAYERSMETTDSQLYLFITFDEMGALKNWIIQYNNWWPGYSGPLAQIPVSPAIDYDDVRNGINEAFESINWEEVSEKLEPNDEA